MVQVRERVRTLEKTMTPDSNFPGLSHNKHEPVPVALRSRLHRGRLFQALVALGLAVLSAQQVAITYLLFRRPSMACPAGIPVMEVKTERVDSGLNPDGSTYMWVFATGRTGTQHLSRVFAGNEEVAYITHQTETEIEPTKHVVDRMYRRLRSARDVQVWVKEDRIPYIRGRLVGSVHKYLYTGHLPCAFELCPTFIDTLPRNSVKILRVRRDRIQTALSLMALGPESQDPWVGVGPTLPLRWFPSPKLWFVRLRPTDQTWASLNRFQKYLWYVDDLECRWQALKRSHHGEFQYLEVQVESLIQFNGAEEYHRIAQFFNLSLDLSAITERHNTIQHKQKVKDNQPEAQLRDWDLQYRRVIGSCEITEGETISWI